MVLLSWVRRELVVAAIEGSREEEDEGGIEEEDGDIVEVGNCFVLRLDATVGSDELDG